MWLAANNLEPKLSPFDPFAIFDEIQRLVPAYDVPRMNLFLGNDEHLKSELVQIQAGAQRRDLVLPSNDRLATSGTLGRYSAKLSEVVASKTILSDAAETAAD